MEPEEITPPPVQSEEARQIKKIAQMLLRLQQAQVADHKLITHLAEQVQILSAITRDSVKNLDMSADTITNLSNLLRKHGKL